MSTLSAVFAATLVDEWAAHGVRHAVIAPGSRSAPLAVALYRDPRITTQVVLDERSAAFVALGIGRATGVPAVVVCTSGSAAAHFHPAVVEADHGDVPMLVCTADRPAELLDTGAGQTIDQHRLYGTAVRWFAAPGAPDTERPELWRSIAARSVARACGPRPGPVHLDLAFREPLVGPGPVAALGTAHAPVRVGRRVLDDEHLDAIAQRCADTERGLLVVGWGSGLDATALTALAQATGWPVLADTISGLRTDAHCVAHYEALVRHAPFAEAHRPDLVVRFGAPLTSKVVTQWLDTSVPQVLVDPHGRRLDPHRAATTVVEADPTPLAAMLAERIATRRSATSPVWSGAWTGADSTASGVVTALLDARRADGAGLARVVHEALPAGTHFLVASSMAVRDLEWFAAARTGLTLHANRGANGIDGLIATATGIALGSAAPTVALLGDLAAHHDASSLVAALGADADLTVVVADNAGGGIFAFLPQAEHCPPGEFDVLFTTAQAPDLVELARAYGARAERVAPSECAEALRGAVSRRGVDVLVVETLDHAADVQFHRAVWAAVADALG